MLKKILDLNLRLLTHGLVLYPHGNSLDQIEPIVDVLDAYNLAIERYKTLNTQISKAKDEINKMNDSLLDKNEKLEISNTELLDALKNMIQGYCDPKVTGGKENMLKAKQAIANADGKPYKPSLYVQMWGRALRKPCERVRICSSCHFVRYASMEKCPVKGCES